MTEPDGPGQGDAQPKDEPGDRPELDVDSAFAAIIAGFADPVPEGVGSWPEIENLPDEARGESADLQTPGVRDGGYLEDDNADGEPGAAHVEPEVPVERPEPLRRRIVLPGEDVEINESHREPADDEEGYVPPDPPPLPRGDLTSRLAWGAVIGGPLFLLMAALTWRTLPSFLLLLALLAFVGGFVTLVARMPQDRPDDPDDGAVV